MLQVKHLLIGLCLLTCALARAQDLGLPQGKAQVIMLSGKILKDVVLWKIHPTSLEYLKNENLHDIPLKDINYVHYPHVDYELNDSNQLVAIEYDKLILLNNDTIFCFIREINPLAYIYNQPGQTTCRSIERYNVRKHILAGVEEIQQTPQKKTESKVDTTSKAHGAIRSTDQSTDYYAMGKTDGQREFKGNGSLTGGILLGLVPYIGWITTPLTLVVPPNTAPRDSQLYKNNEKYRQGYNRGAWNKKARRSLVGMLAGAFVFFAVTAH